MTKDEPYNLMPRGEIVDLKKQLQELRSKRDKTSSKELLNSINALTKSMDAMLKLFTEAAEELKVEGSGGQADMTSINEKLDEIIDQNKAIGEMVEELTEKREEPLPSKTIPGPDFQPPQGPNFNFQQPQSFEGPLNEPGPQQLDQPPKPREQGPIAMPSIPFPSYKKPKKKGLFGRLKK